MTTVNSATRHTLLASVDGCQRSSVRGVGELVGLTEIAELLGISRQRVHKLSQEASGFPEPFARLSAGLIWLRADIEEWARDTGRIS